MTAASWTAGARWRPATKGPETARGGPRRALQDIARRSRSVVSNAQIPYSGSFPHGFRADVLPVLREVRRSQRPEEVRVPELRQVHLQGPHRRSGLHTPGRDRGPLQGRVRRRRRREREEGHGHSQRPGREHRMLRPRQLLPPRLHQRDHRGGRQVARRLEEGSRAPVERHEPRRLRRHDGPFHRLHDHLQGARVHRVQRGRSHR